MSVSVTLKTGDTAPEIELFLEDEESGKKPTDLTEAETIMVLLEVGSTVIEEEATALTPQSEEAKKGRALVPISELTKAAGVSKCEVKITWKDGGVESFPNQGVVEVAVEESL